MLIPMALAVGVYPAAALIASLLGVDSSVGALVFTASALLVARAPKQNIIWALFVPYTLGLFAAIFHKQLTFNVALALTVITTGDRSLANGRPLDIFVNTYCPILLAGWALLSASGKLHLELARVGLWRYVAVRRVAEYLDDFLLTVRLGQRLFEQIVVGLHTRYINLNEIAPRIRYSTLWVPKLVQLILVASLARYEYVKNTGIRLRNARVDVVPSISRSEFLAIFSVAALWAWLLTR